MMDTLRLAQRWEQAGLPRDQATQLVSALSEEFQESAATKADLELLERSLKGDLEALEQRMEAKLGELAQRMDAKIEGLEQRMKTEIAALRAFMLQMLLIFGLGIVSLTVGLIKLL